MSGPSPQDVRILPDAQDLVTVVVPAKDERASIETCLASIAAQTHRALQIVVVDGASTDGTQEVVRRLAAQDPRIELCTDTDGRIAVSMNAGLAAARGRWLARVDAHSTVPPEYVSVLVGHLAEGPWGGVGGRKDATPADTPTARAIAAALGSRAGVGNSAYHYAEEPRTVDHVPFGAYPVELLRSLGGWDASLDANEDYELDYRIRASGRELLLDPSVRIAWRSKETIGALFAQYRRYGRGKADVARLHPSSLAIRHLVPPALVAGAVPWAAIGARRPRAAMLLALPYLVFLAGAGASVAREAGEPRLAPRVALALGAMHVGWGLGFWEGAAANLRDRRPASDRDYGAGSGSPSR
ncbi:MAG: glycosyltransferase family 2 protein [Actinomycetota bacterium]